MPPSPSKITFALTVSEVLFVPSVPTVMEPPFEVIALSIAPLPLSSTDIAPPLKTQLEEIHLN